jgi:hypothetical protein
VQKFLGDVLELPSVDAGEGWPIFAERRRRLAFTRPTASPSMRFT